MSSIGTRVQIAFPRKADSASFLTFFSEVPAEYLTPENILLHFSTSEKPVAFAYEFLPAVAEDKSFFIKPKWITTGVSSDIPQGIPLESWLANPLLSCKFHNCTNLTHNLHGYCCLHIHENEDDRDRVNEFAQTLVNTGYATEILCPPSISKPEHNAYCQVKYDIHKNLDGTMTLVAQEHECTANTYETGKKCAVKKEITDCDILQIMKGPLVKCTHESCKFNTYHRSKKCPLHRIVTNTMK